MISLFGGKRKTWSFLSEPLKESIQLVSNPSRGWYRIYSFAVEKEVNEQEMEVVCNMEEQLAMLQFHIGSYQNQPIDESGLKHVEQIISFFQRKERELIIRFVYDKEGKGMECEPSILSLVQVHMKQVGPILMKYADCIYTLQGIFVGSWGEMHDSKFLLQKNMQSLVQTLYEATEGHCYLAVRKPQQWRTLFPQKNQESAFKCVVGLYNDGMFASESDLGTYGMEKREYSQWINAWCREDELEFQNKLCKKVPNGGEAVQDNSWSDLDYAVESLCKMHISYLHSIYDPKVIKKWKQSIYSHPGVFEGQNGFDYIGAHLGYRFVVRQVRIEEQKHRKVLIIQIENTGFANIYEELEMYLIAKEKYGKCSIRPIHIDARQWESGEKNSSAVDVSDLQKKEYAFYLKLWRKRDEKIIHFANENAVDEIKIGLFFNSETSN